VGEGPLEHELRVVGTVSVACAKGVGGTEKENRKDEIGPMLPTLHDGSDDGSDRRSVSYLLLQKGDLRLECLAFEATCDVGSKLREKWKTKTSNK
jgi:hypothetical protein